MADPEDPKPPNEGGDQDADSKAEISGFDASSGSDEPTAGVPAAPADEPVPNAKPGLEGPFDQAELGHTQNREQIESGPEPAEPALEAEEPDAEHAPAFPAIEEPPSAAPLPDAPPPIAVSEPAPEPTTDQEAVGAAALEPHDNLDDAPALAAEHEPDAEAAEPTETLALGSRPDAPEPDAAVEPVEGAPEPPLAAFVEPPDAAVGEDALEPEQAPSAAAAPEALPETIAHDIETPAKDAAEQDAAATAEEDEPAIAALDDVPETAEPEIAMPAHEAVEPVAEAPAEEDAPAIAALDDAQEAAEPEVAMPAHEAVEPVAETPTEEDAPAIAAFDATQEAAEPEITTSAHDASEPTSDAPIGEDAPAIAAFDATQEAIPSEMQALVHDAIAPATDTTAEEEASALAVLSDAIEAAPEVIAPEPETPAADVSEPPLAALVAAPEPPPVEAAVEAVFEPSGVAAIETVEAAFEPDHDAPAVSAVETLENESALFADAPPEENTAEDAALFPAVPARDEAVLFTRGVELAPEVVAEIIPYSPPKDEPAPEPEAAISAASEAASRAPEDLAAPRLAPQSSALGAAFSWLGARTSTALAWLRARLPRGREKPATPTEPIPSRRRTFWPKPDARPPGFRPSARKIAIMSGWACVLITAAIAGFFIFLTRDLPSTRSLWTANNSTSLTFVDRRGRVIIREGAENAPPVDLKRLPPYVAQAIIAIEDRRFYDHFGVDLSGLMRAAASNMKAGHVVQGGSTITQQLAKNLFLTNNRTFQRKVQEVALALWLESQFSKRDILALYMSRVYFGAGAYGIEAAAERYFDKPARDLTLAEAALLAGLVKAPSKLNPAAQDAAAKARAKIVLDEMLGAGFITAAQHQTALKAPLSISRNSPNGNLGYFRDWIDPQLTQVIGDQRDAFIIETTLDLDAQRAAEATLTNIIERERKARNVSQGAVLAMDATGGVTTMVGGLNYGKGEGQSEFNRTTQSLRAPGSSFKYFIYMAAMAKGMTPWNIYVDKPVVYGDWAPGNYEDKYYGPVTLAAAYAKSLNMVAIQLANDVGGRAVIDTAQHLGVGKRLQDYRSLGLGAQGMTVMEMVTGYGAMASGGYPIEPHGIERVRRANGQVLWARRPAAPPRQVIDDRTMRMMNYLGTGVVRAGTGTRAQIPGREIAGKTGTSNDYRDAWFIGYVPNMVAGVWLGNDNNASMTKVTGGLLAAEVWHDFMVVALRDTPIQQLAMPETEEVPLPEASGEVTETPPAAVVTTPPLAPEAPPPLAITPVGGDG